MQKRLLFLWLLLAAFAIRLHAQEHLYLIKNQKVIAAYPVADIDSLTFRLIGDIDGNLYDINATRHSDCTIEVQGQAVPGQTVIANVTVGSAVLKVSGLYANGEACTYIADNGTTWRYKFTMPEAEVELEAETAIDRHVITPFAGPHAYLTMLNCSDEWDKPADVRRYDEAMGGRVKFYYGADNGYRASIRAYTETGTSLSVNYEEDDPDFGKCYYVVMPDEPLTIEVTARERTDYRGQEFVGEYTGYELQPGPGRLYKAETPTLSLKLEGNTAYTAATTDDNALSIEGMYTYNADNKHFTYVEPSTDQGVNTAKKGYALTGTWLGDETLFVSFSDLDVDRPENAKLYMASLTPFSYACASSDDDASRNLLELTQGDQKRYYYYVRFTGSLEPVVVKYESGSQIGEPCRALVSDLDGNPLLRYELTAADATPSFVFVGNERGTYTLENGTSSDPQLTLDGFGFATYGSEAGTYTIDQSIVSFKGTSTIRDFRIDRTAGTYSPIASAAWDGPKNFSGTTAGAQYDGAASTGTLAVALDSNYAGKETEGKAKVQAFLTDQYGKSKEVIGSTVSYSYDSRRGVLILSGILTGSENGLTTQRIDLEFTVSADKRTLRCDEEVILRAPSGGDTRYIPLSGFELTAQE